jgi:hypothetical protein
LITHECHYKKAKLQWVPHQFFLGGGLFNLLSEG